jgi:DNA polymerase-3 subunit delta'
MAFSAPEAVSLLKGCQTRSRLAHAYLISGPEGSGKRSVAIELAALILDTSSQALAHPDCHSLEPESKSRRIRIDSVRELEGKLQLRSLKGGKKVGILFDADRMQEQASNALLKTLEEPPAQSHLILVTSRPEDLLETILSRCIEVALRCDMRPPLSPLQEKWLAQLRVFSEKPKAQLPEVYFLLRKFQEILAEARETIQEQNQSALKREEPLYKQVGNRAGLEEREEYYKALTESRCIQERSKLLSITEQWWADVLRIHSGAPETALDLCDCLPFTSVLAARLSCAELLAKTSALSTLRFRLNANVQEPVALESGFLAIFATE